MVFWSNQLAFGTEGTKREIYPPDPDIEVIMIFHNHSEGFLFVCLTAQKKQP